MGEGVFIKDVRHYLGNPALLEQCAEECAELAQACLKMSRKMRGENPTPKTMQEITCDLNEEIADVMVTINAIVETGIISNESIESVIMKKEERWVKRLLEKDKSNE